MKEHPLKKGIYQHHKSPDMLYEVLDVGLHTETKEPFVVYKALYGEGGLWIRPYEMFIEEVDKPEIGYRGPRFIFVREV